jgi:SagB-type dehydrogenase family enzyme
MEQVQLPEPDIEGTMPLESCITKRRSVRRYSGEPLTVAQISQLCWAAQGITDTLNGHRAVPSAGATFPAEIFIVTPDGIFRYLSDTHGLQTVSDDDVRPELCNACLGQGFVKQAPLSVIIGMIPKRTTGQYGARGERYVVLEAGHIAQNLHLQAIALGLDSVAVGAYKDNAVAEAVKLPEEIEPVYIVTIGKAE